MTVFVSACAIGKISGCVLNPAVGTGLIFVHGLLGGPFHFLWIYWIAPVAGGVIASFVFFMMNPAAKKNVD